MWLSRIFKKKEIKIPPIEMGFWAEVSKKKPFFVLAPMADVTDSAFRRLVAKYGKPDVTWTEFVSADGLASRGREALMIDLAYSEAERPIVAQIFGSNAENMQSAAKLCTELGFDGIDINMGCPDKSIMKQCSGAAHIKDPNHAIEIIEAVKRGVASAGRTIPVSVKTRLGFYHNEIKTWIPKLLSSGIAALTIHGRTMKELSLVPAHWDEIARVVEIRNKLGAKTLIIGNGDALDIADARAKAKMSGVDGVMLGRAIFGRPWLFDETKTDLSIEEKMAVMLEHTKLFLEMLGDRKNFAIMKKHYKAYVNGFHGAKELRVELMEAETYEKIEELSTEFLRTFKGGEIS